MTKNTQIINFLVLGFCLVLALPSQGANTIASLGTGSFSVTGGNYTMTQDSNGLSANSIITAGSTIYGDWNSFVSPATSNWSGYTGGLGLLMSANMNSNSDVIFNVSLFSDDNEVAFEGVTSNAGISPTTVSLTLLSGDISSLTNVSSFQFTWNGGSDSPAAINLFAIQSIPEPSTGALMLLGAVGLVALRRLRKV